MAKPFNVRTKLFLYVSMMIVTPLKKSLAKCPFCNTAKEKTCELTGIEKIFIKLPWMHFIKQLGLNYPFVFVALFLILLN